MRVLPGDHERAQIALARAHLATVRVDHVDVAELDDLLRDKPARILLDAVGQILPRGLVERRAEHDAVASGFRHVLDDQLAHAVEHFLAVLLEHRHVGRRVVQDRLLVEVVTDHLRHEIVDRLVVRGPVAGRVDDGDVAGTVGRQQSGNADNRVRVERERVEVFVGQSAVHGAHAMPVAGIVEEVQLVVDNFQVFGERERRAGLLGQVGVLEERRIVASRREHDGDAFGGYEVHGLAQQPRIVAVVAHVHVAEQFGIRTAFDVAREQRVAGSRRDAQVVFQHPPAPVLALDEVFACDVREDAAGRSHAVDLRKVTGRRVHVFFGDDAVVDDALV